MFCFLVIKITVIEKVFGFFWSAEKNTVLRIRISRTKRTLNESIVQKLTFEKSDGIFEMERKEG